MNIIVTKDEGHPVPFGKTTDESLPDFSVCFFGLARHRGDNIIYSTRVTDSFFTVIKKHGLTFYPTVPMTKFNPVSQKVEILEQTQHGYFLS